MIPKKYLLDLLVGRHPLSSLLFIIPCISFLAQADTNAALSGALMYNSFRLYAHKATGIFNHFQTQDMAKTTTPLPYFNS